MSLEIIDIKECWALVTGSTEGIGKEFCHQLARLGANIILTARHQGNLENLSKELKETYGVQVRSYAGDLSKKEHLEHIVNDVNNNQIKIRLLVNSVASTRMGPFSELEVEEHLDSANLNMITPLFLIHSLKIQLSQHPTSAVINISSQAALNPLPNNAVYGATKAFLHSLSLALYSELKEENIYVQTLIPGPTKTRNTKTSGIDEEKVVRWLTPKEVVQVSLKGFRSKKPIVEIAPGIFWQKVFNLFFPLKLKLHFINKSIASKIKTN